MPDSPVFNAAHNETQLTMLGFAAILLLGVAVLALPRRHAVVPLILLACFIPGQDVVVMSLNFGGLRILTVFGLIRVLFRQEWSGFRWNRLDTLIIWFALIGTFVYTVQIGTVDALKFQLGQKFDILGMYFLFRIFIRSWESVAEVARAFALISVFVGIAFLREEMTGQNLFSSFGGVPAVTDVREGRLRCQGAYSHPILAGCYWASLLPIMAALWWRKPSDRRWAIIGVLSGLLIIVLCASSTPVAGVAFGFIGAGFFYLRRSMKLVRWASIGLLVAIHLIRPGPVWSLVGRFDFAGGSTGYYRFTVIDSTIRHFDEWWLLGITSNSAWGLEYGHYVTDITNQYVLEGLRGGIWTLALFVAIIFEAFSAIGRLWRRERRSYANLPMSWALGVSVFVHCMAFIGVSYFGQIGMLWYLTLAMIGSMASAASRPNPKNARRQIPMASTTASKSAQIVRRPNISSVPGRRAYFHHGAVHGLS